MILDYDFGKFGTPIIVDNLTKLVSRMLSLYDYVSVADLHDLIGTAIYQIEIPHLQERLEHIYVNNKPRFRYTDTKYGWTAKDFRINYVEKTLCNCGRFYTYQIEVPNPRIIE